MFFKHNDCSYYGPIKKETHSGSAQAVPEEEEGRKQS
jgi:hypothetical protein